jgi:IclR family pca regulon transcriptional regulator
VSPTRTPSDDADAEPPQGIGGVQSVARGLSILELFNERRSELSVNDIAKLTGLNRGTAYRFSRTLLTLGYLEETRPTTFRLGVKCISLAQAALGSREVVQASIPFLERLREKVQATVNMTVLDGVEVVYVVRLLNSDIVALRLGVGSRLPAYATSLGRAILAFLPDDEVSGILDRTEFKAITPWTLHTRDAVEKELKVVRRNGFAYNDQGLAPSIRGVAAPILDATGRPIASINISVFRPTTSTDVLGEFTPAVVETAREISGRITELDIR